MWNVKSQTHKAKHGLEIRIQSDHSRGAGAGRLGGVGEKVQTSHSEMQRFSEFNTQRGGDSRQHAIVYL